MRGFDTSAEAFVMRRALAQLAPEYRDPLLLQVVRGLTCREIAELLGLNSNTVLTRLFRARKTLRERLEEPVQEEATQ